jgi:Polyketide cyclase / dehydrase and lipid transport
MPHLQSVQVLDDKRSHWVTQAITGATIEWDAEITNEEPDTLIAWRSLPGSALDTTGSIRFSKATGDRGTEVHVTMQYLPPAGKVGHWIATLFGKDPCQQMRDDRQPRLVQIDVLPREAQRLTASQARQPAQADVHLPVQRGADPEDLLQFLMGQVSPIFLRLGTGALEPIKRIEVQQIFIKGLIENRFDLCWGWMG